MLGSTNVEMIYAVLALVGKVSRCIFRSQVSFNIKAVVARYRGILLARRRSLDPTPMQ